MVKRQRDEDIAGVLEFEGLSRDDPQLAEWLADHKARGGGKLRVSLGRKGVRVAFAKAADMALWQTRFEQAKAKRSKAASVG